MYDYPSIILDIHDGDTITIERDAGCDLSQKMHIRFNRINAPELNTPEGKAARAYLVQLLSNPDGTYKPIYVFTIKDSKEKYGRYLGDFWIWGEDFTKVPSINDRMVTSGNAVYKKY